MDARSLETAINKHCMVSVTNRDGVIQHANEKFCEVSGYSVNELVGNTHLIINSQKHPTSFFTNLWRTINAGKTFHADICNRAKDGSYWWANTTIIPDVDEEGEITGFTAIRTRIRKTAEEQKEIDSTNIKRTLIEESTDELAIFTEDTLRIIEANIRLCYNTGFAPTEFSEMSLLDLIPSYDYRDLQDILAKVKTSKRSIKFESVVDRKNDTKYDAEVVVRYDREIKAYIATITDITMQKREEMETSQAQKMKILSNVTSEIAHDFNNLLGTILGFNKLIEMQCLSDNFDKSRVINYSKNIVEAGNRTKELVADMAEFSKKADHDTTKYKLYELSSLVDESLDLLSAVLPSGMMLSKKLDSNLYVETNNIKLHQIVMNLCLNAKEAINIDGTIEVGVRIYTDETDKCSSCDSLLNGSFVELYVKDNGKGLSYEQTKDIFKPYYTTKKNETGTGTGLSNVHKIIHEHKGHIVVKSIPNVGSVFSVLFPFVEQPSHNSKDEIEYYPMPGGDRELLIIDDQPALGNFLHDLTVEHGYVPVYFQKGDEAVSYYADNHDKVEVVITDLHMPGMNGLDLIEKITDINSNAKIILCTGNITGVDTTKLPKSTIVLPKPLNISEFFQELDSLIH